MLPRKTTADHNAGVKVKLYNHHFVTSFEHFILHVCTTSQISFSPAQLNSKIEEKIAQGHYL